MMYKIINLAGLPVFPTCGTEEVSIYTLRLVSGTHVRGDDAGEANQGRRSVTLLTTLRMTESSFYATNFFELALNKKSAPHSPTERA